VSRGVLIGTPNALATIAVRNTATALLGLSDY